MTLLDDVYMHHFAFLLMNSDKDKATKMLVNAMVAALRRPYIRTEETKPDPEQIKKLTGEVFKRGSTLIKAFKLDFQQVKDKVLEVLAEDLKRMDEANAKTAAGKDISDLLANVQAGDSKVFNLNIDLRRPSTDSR